MKEQKIDLSREKTPSGGLHIWGKELQGNLTRSTVSKSGIPLECFALQGRITIRGTEREVFSREILSWVPLKDLSHFPSYLLPIGTGCDPRSIDMLPMVLAEDKKRDSVK